MTQQNDPQSQTNPPDATARLNSGINRFAFRLLAHLATSNPTQNLFCSPFSIALAFAMVGHGAKGKTRQQILDCFGLSDLPPAEVNQAFESFATRIDALGDEITLALANSLWQGKGEPIHPDYVAEVKRLYAAEAFTIDFDQPGAADTINQWVAEQTHDRIQQLVTADDLSGAALALLNAIYFKANWQKRFDPALTSDQPFSLLNGSVEQRPLMQQTANFGYFEHELFQAIDLPYGAGDYCMAVLLPRPTTAFAEFQQRFDSDDWTMVRSHFRKEQVRLALPRFSVMQRQLLNQPLQALGIKKAFAANAEFPGISSGLFIAKVIHQATLIVNEEGSEASAATAVVMTRAMLSRPTEMTVDRPFLCIIYQAEGGTILFAGYIVDPQ